MNVRPPIGMRETADLLGVSEATTRRLARQGSLPGLLRLEGRRLLVRRAVLLRWLAGEGEERGDSPPALRAIGK